MVNVSIPALLVPSVLMVSAHLVTVLVPLVPMELQTIVILVPLDSP